jgi:hypothetical protein
VRSHTPTKGVHPVFHVSQLKPHTPNPFPSCTVPIPAPDIIDGDKHFEIDHVVDSKIDKHWICTYCYKVEFTGHLDKEDRFLWVAADELLKTALEAIGDFHAKYLRKPGPLATIHPDLIPVTNVTISNLL